MSCAPKKQYGSKLRGFLSFKRSSVSFSWWFTQLLRGLYQYFLSFSRISGTHDNYLFEYYNFNIFEIPFSPKYAK